MADFAHDTVVRPLSDGAFECEIHSDWWVVAGPNGGYLAAILVHALEAVAGGGERPLRTLTVHYLRAPAAGPARIEVELERKGRSVSFLRARLVQEGRSCALALAVLADARDGLALEQAHPPEVPPPEEIPEPPSRDEQPPFAGQFHYRPAVGNGVFEGAEEAITGGWLRPRSDAQLDSALLVALCDSWFPAVFAVARQPLAVPTLELTVHVRSAGVLPAEWVLGRFVTRTARDGLLEEDGELWSRGGRLLAQSRQLALSL